MDGIVKRVALAVLPLAAAIAVLGWLAWPGRGTPSGLRPVEGDRRDRAERLPASADASPSDQPTLKGVNASPPSRGIVSIRVVGPRGRGLPAVQLRVLRQGEPAQRVVTGRDGRVLLTDELYDGSTCIELDPTDTQDRPLPPNQPVAEAHILGRVVTLRPATGTPLTLRPVDAETGEEVQGVRWAIGLADEALRDAADGPQTLWERLDLAYPCPNFIPIRLVPPTGFVAWDGETSGFDGWLLLVEAETVAARSRELVLQYQLRHEAKLVLQVPKRRSGLADSLVVCGVEIGGHARTMAIAELKEGEEVPVPGIPFLRGQEFSLLVAPREVAMDLVSFMSRMDTLIPRKFEEDEQGNLRVGSEASTPWYSHW